jgi:hypothetical protein
MSLHPHEEFYHADAATGRAQAGDILEHPLPEAMAGFAGAWIGEWEDSGGLCHTLVVEEVFANGVARVIYSHGTSAALNIPLPGFLHATGRIVDGVLRFRLTSGDPGPP